MRVLFQRVRRSAVRVDGQVIGSIGAGALLLVGIGRGDEERDLKWMARKVTTLRVFPDAEGRMNRSLLEQGGAILAVSQFTLYGETRKGRRPSFIEAEEPKRAARLHEGFVEYLRAEGVGEVATGQFGASMEVELINDGPVTLWIESPRENTQEAETAASS